MSRLISSRTLFASSAMFALLVIGGVAFAHTNAPTQPPLTQQAPTQQAPKAEGTTPKCINRSVYIIRVPTDPKQVLQPTGTTNKPIPPATNDEPGCWIKFCTPATIKTATNPKGDKEVCGERFFENDEDLKKGDVMNRDGALAALQQGVAADLSFYAKNDQNKALSDLKDDISSLSPEVRSGITNAFSQQVAADIAAQQTSVNQAEQALKSLQENCLSNGSECGNHGAVAEAQKRLQLEKEALENLNKSKVDLVSTQKANCPSLNPADNCKSDVNSQDCPTGQVRTGGECKASDSTFNRGPGGNDNNSPSPAANQNPAGGQNPFNSILSQLARALMGQQLSQQPTCPTDPQQYQQYQQMFQQQMQQYQFQLQQYNYQQQFALYSGGQSYNYLNQQPPLPPMQCKPATTGGGQCTNEPGQPSGSCPAGWQAVRNSQQCVTSWQCGGAGSSLAQISCQPQLADVGMTVGITFGCSAGTAVGQGFNTNGQNSGSTQATTTSPGAGINTINFGLTCTNQGVTDSKQCTVNLNKPSLIFVANPKVLNSGERSSIGWVTAGMQGCIISSPDDSTFTNDHANNSRKNGVAETPALTSDSVFVLTCTTLAGGTRTASTTVDVR